MVMSDTSCMIDGFTIALLMSEFGQVWASDYFKQDCLRLCKPGFTKSHRSLDNIVSLENRITYEIAYDCTIVQLQTKDRLMSAMVIWAKQGLQKSHTTLGEIIGLHNCAVANITPQLRLNLRARCMVKLM